MTADPDPGQFLLDKIDACEQALARDAADVQARTGELTARLRELEQAIGDLQVTRKTPPGPRQRGRRPALGRTRRAAVGTARTPAYQQILTAFAGLGRPLRARDLYLALDLPVLPKNTGGIRSKLRRLASRGILVETEPGLFAQPRP